MWFVGSTYWDSLLNVIDTWLVTKLMGFLKSTWILLYSFEETQKNFKIPNIEFLDNGLKNK